MTMPAASTLGWRALPRVAQVYVAVVMLAGAFTFATFFPTSLPDPVLFGSLLVAACVTSVWKVTLPLSVAGNSTLSVSYAADLMALLLLGPGPALVIAVAGAWAQCTLNVRGEYPLYRTVFSMAAEAITMAATGLAYAWLGGSFAPTDFSMLTKPLVGAIAVYFLVNTGLIAAAIALSGRRKFVDVWRNDFLWSGSSFMVAGTAGAVSAVIIARGGHWTALLMLAPVYLTYRTYLIFTGRLEDQARHERALAEEKEREGLARASAEEANRLKDQFLAIVSHELRTPLAAILGWAEMLRSGKLDTARRERACQVIFESAKRQAQLIDELLDVARIMSGKLRVDRTSIDLSDIIREALDVVQPLAQSKGVHIALEIDPSMRPIPGDGARLQQIVWNLLSNAVKFTSDGGLVLVRLRRAGNDAELVVTDTGSGIAGDFLPSVFEPFRQADGSTTRQHGGLGLGLSIVKYLVEAHGGTVTAESPGEGCGATFTVSLPLHPVGVEVPEVAAAGPVGDPGLSLEGLSVLVVDDDEESRRVIAAHLENHHARVLTAPSSADALTQLHCERVDVLLADIAMPGEDGYALLRKVRASSVSTVASMPAAALTALAREEDRQRTLEAGFQMHLAKPIDGRSVVRAVASLGRATPA